MSHCLPKTLLVMPARLTVAGVLALLALTVGVQSAAASPALKAPKGLKGFLLRVNEPDSLNNRTFPRTPAFTWSPVAGAKRYDVRALDERNVCEGPRLESCDSSPA